MHAVCGAFLLSIRLTAIIIFIYLSKSVAISGASHYVERQVRYVAPIGWAGTVVVFVYTYTAASTLLK